MGRIKKTFPYVAAGLLLLMISIVLRGASGHQNSSRQKLERTSVWKESSFADFRRGSFEDAGNDLYVSAKGVMQRIHRYDINVDGAVDLVFCNSHDTNDRIDTFVYWGGPDGFQASRRAEVPASGSQSAAIADVNNDGLLDLILPSYYDGDSYRLDSQIYLGNRSGLNLKSSVNLPTLAARDSVVADFNRDGFPDIFFAVPWKDNLLEAEEIGGPLYWGSASGFSRQRSSSIPCRGSAAAAAVDLDGNGYPDLILANRRWRRDAKTKSFIYWNGPEGMRGDRRTELPTAGAFGVALGDVNGDDKLDIGFACSVGGGTPIYINSGAAGFSPEGRIDLPSVSKGIAFADIDKDGDTDAILAYDDSISVYRNEKGRFATRPAFILPASDAAHVTASDLNKDGYPEIIVSNHSAVDLLSCDSYIYWAGPDGYSAQNRTALPTHGASHAVVGDINNDGFPDVVFSNASSGHAPNSPIDSYIYYGEKSGHFSTKRRTGLRTIEVTDVVSADLDGNGFPELAFAGDGRRTPSSIEGAFLYRNGPAGFEPKPFSFPVLGTRGVEAADLNRDGYLDIIFTNPFRRSEPEYPSHSTFIFWGSERGCDAADHYTFSTPEAYRFSLADCDGDGYLDLIVGRRYKNVLSIYWGNSGGKFLTEDRMDLQTYLCLNVNAADLDGDGHVDLIAGNKGSDQSADAPSMIFWGGPAKDGKTRLGVFVQERRTDLPSVAGERSCVADFNKDGRLDICISNYLGNENRQVPSYIYWGDGRRFASKTRTEIAFEAGAGVISADFDRDGWPDLAIASHKNGPNHATLSKVFWGDAKGFFVRQPTELPTVGAHQFQNRNIGNILTRGPGVAYVSSPHTYNGSPSRIVWKGTTPGRTGLTFQMRAASTVEKLREQGWSTPISGNPVDLSKLELPSQGVLQYRVDFISPDGGMSPTLSEVSIEFRVLSSR